VSTHDERLHVPWTWWPLIGIFLAFGILEVGSGFDYHVLIPVTIFMIGFFVVPPAMAGRERVRLADGVLTAGKKSMPVTQMTTITPLDREQARLRLGPQADPAAYTLTRGWVGSAVMIKLANPHPVPYWVVSTRHPEELATALKQARTEAKAAR
jgi:hypothetical protein